jgi:predicted acetyltransferase
MDSNLLIDAIVRQTTVLIAQLSTAAGIRAPLAHIADQVFVALAQEIERQGVGRKVVADMFGMALRTYQKRVQRLSESASVRGRTLWEAVYDFLSEREAVRRSQIEARFRRDSAEDLGAVLNDLVSSGLVFATGRGADALYRALSASERRDTDDTASIDVLADMAWLAIYRSPKLRLSELGVSLGTSLDRTRRAVEQLVAEGIVRRMGSEPDAELQAENFVVQVDSARGWEASVFDHFSTVCASIAAKVQLGAGARQGEAIGGATFSFDVYQAHPFEERVMGLLTRLRAEVDALWNEVAEYNRAHPVPDEAKTKVSFYFGQNVQDAVPARARPVGAQRQSTEGES